MSETSTLPERDARRETPETPAAAARRLLKSVVLLLSELSDHTRNLRADPRASLLLDNTAGLANRMAGERLTLTGHVAPVEDATLRRRYLARHPGATRYEGFADFAYWAMTVERCHLVGGFADAHWLDAAEVVPALPDGYALVEAEPDILEHMNADHRDAVDVYANHLARRGGQGWRLTGVDRDGIDLRRGGETARVSFDTPVDDAAAAKEALIALVTRARAVAAGERE
ncbi:MAG: DUF2470 domain-containing protein [Deinococcus-Thermus bacterium]|jgi:putative heme iron utilization protein|nr:DUF2470 domain-containing protein [Deinococcota bacterium]